VIYLDHHATTPVDPRVFEAMQPYFTTHFGNAASRNHAYGWAADHAVERARDQVAGLIGAIGKEIVFTSGATESINLALKGAAMAYASAGRHLVTTNAEHPATLDSMAFLETQGFEVTYLPVDETGRVSPEQVAAALRPDTVLVSLLHGNNEVGTLQPLAEIGALCHEKGVLLHVDAAQATGKVPLDVTAMPLDLVSISAHKLYGPKGVGALYVRRKGPRVRLEPQMHGGGHERGMRSGTLNVPGIVGLGEACAIAQQELPTESVRLRELRDRLYQALTTALPGVTLNGHPTERLPGNLNVSFAAANGQRLMASLKELAVSSGSACTTASLEPSHVLRALGVSPELAHNSLRFGLGRFTTAEEIDRAAAIVIEQVQRLRAEHPLSPTGDPHADPALPHG
jgi:cysteine desulfurase